MHRVMIFSSGVSGVPAILIRSALAALASRNDMELVAVCVPRMRPFAASLCRQLRNRAVVRVRDLLDPALRLHEPLPRPVHLSRGARRLGFEIITPPEGDINHPAFLDRLRNEIQPTVALSFYCLQTFSPALLGVFEQAINYHNALLPKYRGLHATAWSVCHGEEETGYTFHRMTERLDRGAILLQGAVPVRPGRTVSDLECGKAALAAGRIPDVLRMVADNEPGRPQQGEGSYFSLRMCRAIVEISDPSALSSDELMKRLRTFLCLRMRLAGRWYSITKLRRAPDQHSRGGRFSFRASDGVLMEATRFRYLPWPAYRALSWLWERRLVV